MVIPSVYTATILVCCTIHVLSDINAQTSPYGHGLIPSNTQTGATFEVPLDSLHTMPGKRSISTAPTQTTPTQIYSQYARYRRAETLSRHAILGDLKLEAPAGTEREDPVMQDASLVDPSLHHETVLAPDRSSNAQGSVNSNDMSTIETIFTVIGTLVTIVMMIFAIAQCRYSFKERLHIKDDLELGSRTSQHRPIRMNPVAAYRPQRARSSSLPRVEQFRFGILRYEFGEYRYDSSRRLDGDM